MAELQTPDPQFGTVKLLRPFANFVAITQGQVCTNALLFTELGQTLDKQAGKPGYDPRLCAATAVPLGSRVILWLPYVEATNAAGHTDYYQWIVGWRLRNLFDFRTARIPYHFPRQAAGVTDTGADGGPRVVIPWAMQTIAYNQPEPAALAQVSNHLLGETMRLGSNYPPAIISETTGITLDVSQGTFNPHPTAGTLVIRVYYSPYEWTVLGDEIFLAVNRPATGIPEKTWDFTAPAAPHTPPVGIDYNFGQAFTASEMVGVYMFVGVAP